MRNFQRIIKKNINILVSIVMMIAIVFFCASTIVASSYTVNQSDDYSHAMEIGQFHIPAIQYIGESFGFMSRMYVNWAGNFFSMFCQSLLSPLNMGGNLQLRVVMVCNALLYLGLLAIMLYMLLTRIAETESWLRLLTIALIFYSIMNYRIYAEVFYWFSGATSYSIPLIFVFVSFLLIITYDQKLNDAVFSKRNSIFIALATFLVFCGAGGSLAVTGTINFIVFLRMIYLYLNKDYHRLKATAIVFAGCVVGAIVNVIAPGNYARADRSAGNLGLASAAKNTIIALYSEYYWLFKNTNYFFVLVMLIIVGILVEEKFRANIIIYSVVSLIGLLTPVVTVFPVVFGYNSTFMSNRTLFVIDQAVILSVSNIAIVAGIWISKYVGIASKKVTIISFAAVALCYLTISDFGLEYNGSLFTYRGLMNGSYARYYESVNTMQDYFNNSKGQDIVVRLEEVPVGLDNYSNFYLENGWANGKIADYYGMNSLTLVD